MQNRIVAINILFCLIDWILQDKEFQKLVAIVDKIIKYKKGLTLIDEIFLYVFRKIWLA